MDADPFGVGLGVGAVDAGSFDAGSFDAASFDAGSWDVVIVVSAPYLVLTSWCSLGALSWLVSELRWLRSGCLVGVLGRVGFGVGLTLAVHCACGAW